MAKFTVTLELPATVHLTNKNGLSERLNLKDIPVNCLADILVGGATIISLNTYNSGGESSTADEKLARMQKRHASWYKGEYRMTERAESVYTGMWNAYVDDIRAKRSCPESVVVAERKALVEKHAGKEVKNTVPAFFDSLAAEIAEQTKGDKAAILEAIEAKYQDLAEIAAREAAKTKAKLDVTDIDLSAYMKPAK